MSKKSKIESITKVVYRCDVCSEVFELKKQLIGHLEEAHSSAYIISYSCPFCGLILKNKESQKIHALKCIKDNNISSSSSRSVDQELLLLQLLNAVLTALGKSKINKIKYLKKNKQF